MKGFVIRVGKFLLDFSVWIGLILAGLVFVGGIVMSNVEPYSFIIGTVMAISIIISVFAASFVLYILIDIRDLLKKILSANQTQLVKNQTDTDTFTDTENQISNIDTRDFSKYR